MAHDPHRDLLPVKEDYCRSGKGSGKFDYQLLGKLTRCELEDRFLRLLDEQTHIKKLANCQEEKIKRLGTKLLRLVNEKKCGAKSSENKDAEDLRLKIIELEHENYALKDKNTVLKQQLSSHSRLLSTQRSPNRSNHTSPLMTMRQSGLQTQCESGFEEKTAAAEMQLQEAEAHIKELNDEIKCLHHKIDLLQQNLEKNSLDSRKIKVTENIELIRLHRSLKQQAIQIAALQAQVKNSENNQKILKEELIKAHNDNDEALHVISMKQNEILNLCSKLEEENLYRLQENELKSRVQDLMRERDCLKERSDFLMKTIASKNEENERVIELQKLLADEKLQKGKLQEALERLGQNKGLNKESTRSLECENNLIQHAQHISDTGNQKEDTRRSVAEIPEGIEGPCNKCNHYLSLCKCSEDSFLNVESESDPGIQIECIHNKEDASKFCESIQPVEKYFAEKMKLERELQYMRDMLRSQTCRCEAQQAEINRLMYEIKVNEEKCNETLQRLDWHLKIFQTFEISEFEALIKSKQKEQIVNATGEPVLPNSDSTEKYETGKSFKEIESGKGISAGIESKEVTPTRRKSSKLEETHSSKILDKDNVTTVNVNLSTPDKDLTVYSAETKKHKRFVDQKFLCSSDEEDNSSEALMNPFMRTLKKNISNDSLKLNVKNQDLSSTRRLMTEKNSKNTSSKEGLDSGVQSTKWDERDHRKSSKEFFKQNLNEAEDQSEKITISILWFEMKPDSSLSKNSHVEMLFIDFMFLNVNGVETETPQSLPKPKTSKEKCNFNFTRSIDITESQKKMLVSSITEPDYALITFKVVSDSERFDETNDECEDVGIAIVTVKDFISMCNKQAFSIEVKNVKNIKETVGALSVKIEATPGILNNLFYKYQ